MNTPRTDFEIDRLARKRAGAKMGWYTHAAVYVAVNLLLVAIAFFGEHDSGGRQWPIYPALGWGLGLLLHGVGVFVVGAGSGLKERLVERERRKLER